MVSITALVSAKEMSQRLKGCVSECRLIELATSGIIPHYTVDGVVMFGAAETREWIDHNFIARHPGMSIGKGLVTVINVVSPAADDVQIPIELRGISNFLIPMKLESVESHGMSGVYFLCSRGSVVYVGQSVNVLTRVGAHFGSKTFDFVFFIRAPESDLNFIEGEFIRLLKPKYNWSKDGDKLIAPVVVTGRDSEPSEESVRIVAASKSRKRHQ